MPALDPGFLGVAAGAKRLEIAGAVGQRRVRPDRLDVIDLEPPAFAAFLAAKTVTLEDIHSQDVPALGRGDAL